jgi:hypothetical protein
VTWAQVFGRLAELAGSGKALGYDFVVVDEAQDLSMAEARFLAAMAGGKPDGLFFTGDLGQRIFQQPFSWKAMGIDVRGRSHGLKINYRTSHQIRTGRTGSCQAWCRTWTAPRRAAAAPYRCSTAR